MRNKKKTTKFEKMFSIILSIYLLLLGAVALLKFLKIEVFVNMLSVSKNIFGVIFASLLIFLLVTKVDEKRFGQKMMLASAVLLAIAFLLNDLLAIIKMFFGSYISNDFYSIVLIDFLSSAASLLIGLIFEFIYKLREKHKK